MKTALLLTVLLSVIGLSALPAEGEEQSSTGQTSVAEQPPAPALPPPFIAGRQPMFQPVAMDPALVRQSMQARSEYDDLNRQIIARQTKLYEENPKIKELQAELRDLQQKIDKLLTEDEELNALKKKFEAITPELPMGSRRGFATNAPPALGAPQRSTPPEPGR